MHTLHLSCLGRDNFPSKNYFYCKVVADCLSLICIWSLCIISVEARADLPDAPVIIEASAGGCSPKIEICGDGIDQDCNGEDLLCPGNDRDRDGFSIGQDCDDTNRKVYPGIAVPCTVSGQAGVQTCQSNGTYSACSTVPLCEAKGSGQCYYISRLTGNDTNAGSFNSPWKTYLNIFSYYSGAERPAGWKGLVAGDVVYFMSGVYTETHTYSSYLHGLYVEGLAGTTAAPIVFKAYPGASPVFSPGSQVFGIYFHNSQNIVVEGLEITKGYGGGIRLTDSKNVEIRNCWIHDNDGIDNNNIAGAHVNLTEGLNFHNNMVNDNYDRTCEDTAGIATENSRNMVMFAGGNNRVHHNVIFQTQSINAVKSGSCFQYKHSATIPGSTFEIDHNVMWNCKFHGIGSATYNSHIHHNLIMDSEQSIYLLDPAGEAHYENSVIENNTIVHGNGLVYTPTTAYGPLGPVTFRKNIVVDFGNYNIDKGMLRISPYGDDTLYNQMITSGNLIVDNNCYYNPDAPAVFNVFGANGGSWGTLGGQYSFSQWKALGFDAHSVVADPKLDSNYVPLNTSCQSYGWSAP